MTEDKVCKVIDLVESGEEITCVLRVDDDVLYVDLDLDTIHGDITPDSLELVLIRSLVLQDTVGILELFSGRVSLDVL